ncbi:hypothetical protein QL093DRAFT_2576904 [Fusarium oxysporum]|nr:hypothetical protein QL093DRAFT_2576904 [Fusarium oxysporum]
MGLDSFTYDPDHRVIVCRPCGTCLVPRPTSWKSHLRAQPHRMRGEELRLTIEQLSSYSLRPVDELRQWRVDRKRPCRPIEGLTVYEGYICCTDDAECDYCTRRIEKMHDHMPAHGKRASQYTDDRSLWRSCRLQTYFTAKGLIDYFVIDDPSISPRTGAAGAAGAVSGPPTLGSSLPISPSSQEEGKLFEDLKADVIRASRDVEEKASVVEGIDESRADRVPWLIHTGFPTHLRGLRDTEIISSYALPRSIDPLDDGICSEDDEDDDDHNDDDENKGDGTGRTATDLRRILAAAEGMLRDAYRLCSDKSPERKMTQQRAKRLSNFRGEDSKLSSIKADKFRSFKNESSLTSYFRIQKQLLAYYYRTVFRADGHFTRERDDQIVPRDTIEATSMQQQAMKNIISILRRQDKMARGKDGKNSDDDDDDDDDDHDHADNCNEGNGVVDGDCELKHAIRKFCISLICQTVGSRPFRSAILSFCAMKSRKKSWTRQSDKEQRRLCTWHKPGNFNSNLSALTWTAQLILFDFICFQKQDDEDRIPDLLDQMCKKYFQQMTETPYGHILQWRLYLFVASSTELATHQARWSLDGETVDYMGKQLRMEQVSQLALSEFRQAHSLLYDELLFGMEDVAPIEAWRLNDDLDLEDYGASWMTDSRNREILAGTHDALLRQIEGRASLRRVFIRPDQRGLRKSGGGGGSGGRTCLCPKAMAIYEAHVQEFLRRMLTLIQILPGPPLRSPELLSITYINTGPRRRSVLIWEKLVMIHVRYHKSQERTGAEKDNIRFLPPAVGDLLLTYLAFVPPLRQVFLRQSKPGALLSPYLWSKLGGEVWRDGMVSSCLRRACTRAEVPQFQVAWWRQVAASITKEKFSPKEQANFHLHEIATLDEVEDETELADLAGMSNHSFRTFNFAYAGSTTLTVTNSLHRAYRASQSWRSLFRIDSVLQGKRPRTVSEAQAQGSLLSACKKTQFRTRPVAREDGITSVARRLYNDPDLQLRRPGQRDALLATVGLHAPEQVVVVLATGSGKTLIFMVGAALEGSATTILILPTVALSGNMLGRLDKVALKHHIWHPGSRRSAPIVIVSAEAACTESFLEYANQLCSRQQLDRIVVDECHLTITAGSYRRSMSQLAWHVRQIRTQTIWLTATLPPVYQELFIEHNKLVRPHVIRESTNRPNIRYIVRRECGPGSLCERAVRLVQSCLTRTDLFFERGRDKVIIYCPTKELVAELAEMLSCPSYTADSGTAEEKRAILERWLADIDSPVIVATSALGPGFDHPYIRCVIHIGAPVLLTDFSQESGRAGRDGKRAESIVLLSAAWEPQLDRRLVPDEEAMQLYLTQRYCSRGIVVKKHAEGVLVSTFL